jgi:hypothetical protein
MSLKEQVKNYAYELGADLIGFGGIDRCRHAPPMMSPQGLYPDAKTVIVMGIHHPDACVELGGDKHPQDMGPYSVQGDDEQPTRRVVLLGGHLPGERRAMGRYRSSPATSGATSSTRGWMPCSRPM